MRIAITAILGFMLGALACEVVNADTCGGNTDCPSEDLEYLGVSLQDLNDNFFTSSETGDFNGDGFVDYQDLTIFGEHATCVDPFKNHGFTHPAVATDRGVNVCRDCHGSDLLTHKTVTANRNCAAPDGFHPLGIESRVIDTGVFGEIESIGSKTAPMRPDDQIACYSCHGTQFNDDMEDGHWSQDFECVACHEGREEEDHEPFGRSPGDKHCERNLVCLDCHHPNDERLEKCDD